MPDLSLTRLVEAARAGASELTKAFGVTAAQAERIAKADPEVLLRIEELELRPTTAIRLNTAPLGEPPAWQALEDLSTGQKATAVLLLLLLESDAPLIVDQPEDDLDNRFITEGVVPRMREEKQRRQFVFSTHNANIPVLGDAELIVGLTASGEADGGRARIAPEHVGSIDARPVRSWWRRSSRAARKPSSGGAASTDSEGATMNRTELDELIHNGENSGVEFKRDDVVPERSPRRWQRSSTSRAATSFSVSRRTEPYPA